MESDIGSVFFCFFVTTKLMGALEKGFQFHYIAWSLEQPTHAAVMLEGNSCIILHADGPSNAARCCIVTAFHRILHLCNLRSSGAFVTDCTVLGIIIPRNSAVVAANFLPFVACCLLLHSEANFGQLPSIYSAHIGLLFKQKLHSKRLGFTLVRLCSD